MTIVVAGACGEVRESTRDGAPPSADAATDTDGGVTADAADARDAGPVFDDEVVVIEASDGEPGSLRELIQDADGDTLVTFDPDLPSTLVMTEGPIELDGAITLAGPGADELALTTEGTSGLFVVEPGARLVLEGLTLTDAPQTVVVRYSAELVARDSAFTDNTFTELGGGSVILNHGDTTVERSLVARNVSDCGAGCNDRGAVLQFQRSSDPTFPPSFTARDTTFSENLVTTGGAAGAALFVQSGSLVLERCTITENRCEAGFCGGGAVTVLGDENSSETVTAEISASIISGNSSGEPPADFRLAAGQGSASGESLGSNVFGDVEGIVADSSDITGNDSPGLTELGDHGGAFETHVPLPGSPALERVPEELAGEIDARGKPRRADGESMSDVGAVERQPDDPTVR